MADSRDNVAAVTLGSAVAEAALIPTDPISAEQNYCDDCRLCKAACASEFIDGEERVTVTMGGTDFSYSRKHHHSRPPSYIFRDRYQLIRLLSAFLLKPLSFISGSLSLISMIHTCRDPKPRLFLNAHRHGF